MNFQIKSKKSHFISRLVSLSCTLLYLSLPVAMHAQVPDCLFNCANTDCGDVMAVDYVVSRDFLQHGVPQGNIINRLENWVDEILDESKTTCCNVRINRITNRFQPSEKEGTYFHHVYKGFTVNLPTSCGGQSNILIRFRGDCPRGPEPGEVNAELIIKVYDLPEVSVPADQEFSICNNGVSDIKTAFDAWVDDLRWPDELTNPICSSSDFDPAVCFYDFNDAAIFVTTVSGLGPTFGLQCKNLLTGETDFDCLKTQLKSRYHGDCAADISITLGFESSVIDCVDRKKTVNFKVTSPTLNPKAGSPQSPGACANQARRTGAFQDWIGTFNPGFDCAVKEIFTIDKDYDNYLTRAEMEDIRIEECRDSIEVSYAVGCGNDIPFIIRTMYFTQPKLIEEHVTVCSGEPINLELALEPLARFNLNDVVVKYQRPDGTDDPPEFDASELRAITFENTGSIPFTTSFPIVPVVKCGNNEDFCEGEWTTMSVTVRPPVAPLIPEDVSIDVGQPLGIALNHSFGSLATKYEVDFIGFEHCTNAFTDGTYTKPQLENLFSRQATANCTQNCAAQEAQIIITPKSSDCSGNPATYNVTINHIDEVTPQISCPADFSIQCQDDLPACVASDATATDDCSTPTVTCDESTLEGGPCGGSIIRTYTATDASGNTMSCEQTITVNDDTPPSITCPPDATLTLSAGCMSDTSVQHTGVATAEDNCSEPSISYTNKITNGCGASYTIVRTWTATDQCGNSISCDQQILVLDESDPLLVCPPNVEVYLDDQCIGDTTAANTGTATATDNCNEVTISRSDQVQLGCGSEMVITRTWTAMDPCGNSTSCDQIIMVQDTTSPVINCPSNVELFLNENCAVDDSPPVTGMATATDNCSIGQDLVITHSDEVVTGCGSSSIVNRTWTVTDACNNSSSCVQIITISDIIPPKMDCLLNVELGCNPEVPNASPSDLTAQDNCGSVEILVSQGTPVQEGCYFRRTDTYTAIDPCGNQVQCSRDLRWKEDRVGPIISGAPGNLSISCQDNVPAPATGITAEDNCDGPLPVTYREEVINATCGGTLHRRTWTATDECGNTSTKRQVISLDDNVPPVLTVPSDITIELGDAMPSSSYEVTDQCSEVKVSMEEIRTDGDPGEYTVERIWTARDGCGNTTVARQMIQVEDNTPPEIMIVNPMLVNIPNGGSMDLYDCEDPAVAMADALIVDANPDVALVTFDKLVAANTCETFGYYRKWKCGYIATDGAGNESEYSFYVLQYDTTAPELIGVPPDLALSCDAGVSAPLAEVNAEDACQGTTPVEFHETQLLNPADTRQSALLRTWSATDGCGNTTQASQTITFCDFDIEMAASSLGNKVWFDVDGNGIQDVHEAGLNDVKINLYWIDPAGAVEPRMIDSTRTQSVTGKDGQFNFDYLFPGKYQVEIEVPEHLELTSYKMGDNDTLDSDIELQTHMTSVIQLDTHQNLTTIDVGLISKADASLPVELTSFHGHSQSCVNQLSWSTASETQVDVFEIQRSEESKPFHTIADQMPIGGRQVSAQYFFEDDHPPAQSFYRLKMIDLDGTFEYSQIVAINLDCDQAEVNNLIIYPNPTSDLSSLQFEIDKSSQVQIRILDNLGRLISDEKISVYQGINIYDLNLQQQPDGMYWVQINLGDQSLSRKIIKTR